MAITITIQSNNNNKRYWKLSSIVQRVHYTDEIDIYTGYWMVRCMPSWWIAKNSIKICGAGEPLVMGVIWDSAQ